MTADTTHIALSYHYDVLDGATEQSKLEHYYKHQEGELGGGCLTGAGGGSGRASVINYLERDWLSLESPDPITVLGLAQTITTESHTFLLYCV